MYVLGSAWQRWVVAADGSIESTGTDAAAPTGTCAPHPALSWRWCSRCRARRHAQPGGTLALRLRASRTRFLQPRTPTARRAWRRDRLRNSTAACTSMRSVRARAQSRAHAQGATHDHSVTCIDTRARDSTTAARACPPYTLTEPAAAAVGGPTASGARTTATRTGGTTARSANATHSAPAITQNAELYPYLTAHANQIN